MRSTPAAMRDVTLPPIASSTVTRSSPALRTIVIEPPRVHAVERPPRMKPKTLARADASGLACPAASRGQPERADLGGGRIADRGCRRRLPDRVDLRRTLAIPVRVLWRRRHGPYRLRRVGHSGRGRH